MKRLDLLLNGNLSLPRSYLYGALSMSPTLYDGHPESRADVLLFTK